MAKKKFDTNPLDPTFPEKAREAETVVLPKNQFKTSEFPPPSVTEEQTRRFEDVNFNAYDSPYNGQDIPANYKTASLADMNKSSSRKVAKIGLPENILTALAYIPFWIGLVAGLLQLFFVPKSETKVRFHAAQGLAAHIAIFIVGAILQGMSNFVPFANAASKIFWIVTTVMLIIFAVKAWKGKPVHIESVDDLTEWLEEKSNRESKFWNGEIEMYCSTCGTLINTELNYCNRCGARVDKLATTEKSEALEYLSMATGFVGLGGLGLTVGLIAILLNFGVIPEVLVMLAIAFLATVFGISFLMVRQISQMSNATQSSKKDAFENPQLSSPNTAQLEEPRQPARSVTENTTRTLEKELVK